MVALALPVVVGVLGLGTEVGYWYSLRAEMQRAADLAVHAGAVELGDSGDPVAARAAAYSAAMLNGVDSVEIEVTFETTDEGDAIAVTANREASRYFSRLLHAGPTLDIDVRSAGLLRPARYICVLALGSDGDGVVLHGSAELDATGCSVHSNALDSDAVDVSGSALIRADCVSMMGSGDIASGGVVLAECGDVETDMVRVDDPYADVEPPSLLSPPFNTVRTSHWESEIASGRYDQIDLKGDVTIENGATIIVDGGTVRTFGNVDLSGDDVTIILINGASLNFGANTVIDLSAKETGDYAGLLFIGDRTAEIEDHVLEGGTGSTLTGAIYLPTGSLDLSGGSTSDMGCTHLITHAMEFSGQSLARNNCDTAGVRSIRLNKMAGFGFID